MQDVLSSSSVYLVMQRSHGNAAAILRQKFSADHASVSQLYVKFVNIQADMLPLHELAMQHGCGSKCGSLQGALHLCMLADGVEAGSLCQGDVKAQRLRSWSSIQAVWPHALVKGPCQIRRVHMSMTC